MNQERTTRVYGDVVQGFTTASEEVPVNVPYLVVLAGDVMGRVIKLDLDGQVDAGRSRSCAIFLDDQNISRRHVKIRVDEDGRTVLTDLNSTNGTLVNGKRVTEHVLTDGDRICMGNVILRYSLKDDLEFVLQQELFDKATKDQLTNSYNKAFFLDAFNKEFNFHRRSGKPMSLLIFDLDNFKKVNDTYGHANGDIVLSSFARELSHCLRNEDLFARYGGEEFVSLFRNTDHETAMKIAGKLLRLVRAMKFSTPVAEFRTSVTIGLATLDGNNFKNPEEMFMVADQKLYEGKLAGKDRVVG